MADDGSLVAQARYRSPQRIDEERYSLRVAMYYPVVHGTPHGE